jgi:hypothetical protein
MEQIIEWLMSLDTTAISTAIVGLITTYGASIVILVIGLLKSKLKKASFEEALAKNKTETNSELLKLMDDFKIVIVNSLTDIQQELLAKDAANQRARLETLKALAKDAQTANVELNTITETSKDINSILDDLE